MPDVDDTTPLTHRSRTRLLVGLAVLLLIAVAAAPFLPRGDDDRGQITPSAQRALQPAATAGEGEVTPEMQAEIDRVLAEGKVLGRSLGRTTGAAVAPDATRALVRCADFEGQTYCLGTGWTDRSEAEVQARMATAARTAAAKQGVVETTGDLDPLAELAARAKMSPADRTASERDELVAAARSVAKVWLLRHEIQGVPLPEGFLERHPEAVATTETTTEGATIETTTAAKPTATATPTSSPSATPTATPSGNGTDSPQAQKKKHYADYQDKKAILSWKIAREQTRSYWCGPTSMQMVATGWQKKEKSQDHWADKLGTTTSGTSITDMVRVTNKVTGWDKEEYAGTYIVLDISDWSFRQWYVLNMRHLADYRAPLILHPILLKRYYPYLDDDASGHYQVGRGYDKRGDKTDQIGFFEPWNQNRFDPSEPVIERVQWRDAYRSYRANQAHYLHNIGV